MYHLAVSIQFSNPSQRSTEWAITGTDNLMMGQYNPEYFRVLALLWISHIALRLRNIPGRLSDNSELRNLCIYFDGFGKMRLCQNRSMMVLFRRKNNDGL
jgi:hypothetical protein